ncbi:hypothetical protein B296_00010443 [Ensete ventricosum]|uniref:Uncharacterized protein n=1 Tax=Ensete ventricosum TaxID=4639 RepID=A0A426ZNB4_ENSVE|nr:hypothetical protein B296_00010443 [Ensete ventricosum]
MCKVAFVIWRYDSLIPTSGVLQAGRPVTFASAMSPVACCQGCCRLVDLSRPLCHAADHAAALLATRCQLGWMLRSFRADDGRDERLGYDSAGGGRDVQLGSNWTDGGHSVTIALIMAEICNSGTIGLIVAKIYNSGTIGPMVVKTCNSSTTRLRLAEMCNLGTVGLIVAEVCNSGTTGLMVAEICNLGTIGLMVAEVCNSGTTGLMVAEMCNSGTIGLIVIEICNLSANVSTWQGHVGMRDWALRLHDCGSHAPGTLGFWLSWFARVKIYASDYHKERNRRIPRLAFLGECRGAGVMDLNTLCRKPRMPSGNNTMAAGAESSPSEGHHYQMALLDRVHDAGRLMTIIGNQASLLEAEIDKLKTEADPEQLVIALQQVDEL